MGSSKRCSLLRYPNGGSLLAWLHCQSAATVAQGHGGVYCESHICLWQLLGQSESSKAPDTDKLHHWPVLSKRFHQALQPVLLQVPLLDEHLHGHPPHCPPLPFKPADQWNAAKAQLSGTVPCDFPRW